MEEANIMKSNAGSSENAVAAIEITQTSTTENNDQLSEHSNQNIMINNNSSHNNNDSSTSDNESLSSNDASDIAIAAKYDEYNEEEDDELQATPGHLHALANRMTSPARLLPKVQSDSKLVDKLLSPAAALQQRRRSASRSVNSSRSSSPAMPRRGSGSQSALMVSSDEINTSNHTNNTNTNNLQIHNLTSTATSHASTSSLHSNFDPDLLLDRLGFIDLDPPLPHEIRCGPLAAPGSIDGKSNNAGGLTPVNERLCDETLEDCHAFQDLVILDKLLMNNGGNNKMMSSTMSMPSVHSTLFTN